MNSRRLMRTLVGLRPHITTPLRKNAAVHHSKNCVLMSQMGQKRTSRPNHGMPAIPLKPDISRCYCYVRSVP